jgi:hypothetical protein
MQHGEYRPTYTQRSTAEIGLHPEVDPIMGEAIGGDRPSQGGLERFCTNKTRLQTIITLSVEATSLQFLGDAP